MGTVRYVSRVLMLWLIAGAAAAEPYVLEPRVAKEESDTWKAVSWCSEYRGYFELDGQVWTVYEAVAMKAVATSENCRKASADPEKEYVGIFYVKHRRLTFGFFRVCLTAGLTIGKIDGFIQRDGREVPYFVTGASSDGSCEAKDALIVWMK